MSLGVNIKRGKKHSTCVKNKKRINLILAIINRIQHTKFPKSGLSDQFKKKQEQTSSSLPTNKKVEEIKQLVYKDKKNLIGNKKKYCQRTQAGRLKPFCKCAGVKPEIALFLVQLQYQRVLNTKAKKKKKLLPSLFNTIKYQKNQPFLYFFTTSQIRN